ncbi:MAG: DUF2608 domain-containing protein [Waddliaceae bacterium]
MIRKKAQEAGCFFLFLIVVFSQHVRGEIVESQTMMDLIKFSNRETLVVLDLTDTLLKSTPSGINPVEPMTPEVIHQLQERGILLLGLTAGSSKIAKKRVHQLASIAIDLSKSTVYPEEIEFKSKYPAKFLEGIIFAGSRNDKGKTLFCLLDHIRLKPKKILFIDDQIHNVRSVDAAAKKRQIPFLGLYYTPIALQN